MVSAATVPCGDAPRGDGRARSYSDRQRAAGLATRDSGRREMQVVRAALMEYFFGAAGLSLVCGLRAAAMWRFDAKRTNFSPFLSAPCTAQSRRDTQTQRWRGPLRVDGLSFVVARQVRAL